MVHGVGYTHNTNGPGPVGSFGGYRPRGGRGVGGPRGGGSVFGGHQGREMGFGDGPVRAKKSGGNKSMFALMFAGLAAALAVFAVSKSKDSEKAAQAAIASSQQAAPQEEVAPQIEVIQETQQTDRAGDAAAAGAAAEADAAGAMAATGGQEAADAAALAKAEADAANGNLEGAQTPTAVEPDMSIQSEDFPGIKAYQGADGKFMASQTITLADGSTRNVRLASGAATAEEAMAQLDKNMHTPFTLEEGSLKSVGSTDIQDFGVGKRAVASIEINGVVYTGRGTSTGSGSQVGGMSAERMALNAARQDIQAQLDAQGLSAYQIYGTKELRIRPDISDTQRTDSYDGNFKTEVAQTKGFQIDAPSMSSSSFGALAANMQAPQSPGRTPSAAEQKMASEVRRDAYTVAHAEAEALSEGNLQGADYAREIALAQEEMNRKKS